jgi:DnaJ-class molecular chaperone
MKNYYEILNINKNVSEEKIYDAYRNKIAQFNHLPFHTQKMILEIKLLKEALYVLGDENKRKKYDNKIDKLEQYNLEGRNIDSTKICNRLFSVTY